MFGEKKKLTRSEYGVEEYIMEMLFKLNDRKSANLFKQPVDEILVPDYYKIILNPMDLTTIANKLKYNRYEYAEDVRSDLDLIISNCNIFNRNNCEILKQADQFQECINTDWSNFLKELNKKGISLRTPMDVTMEVHERLLAMEEARRKKKSTPSSIASLMDSDSRRRFGYSYYEYYTHISDEHLKNITEERNKVEDPFSYFYVKVDGFLEMTEEQRRQRMRVNLPEELIQEEFEQLSKRKLEKYKKILNKKIRWFDQKILAKVMESKKYSGLSVPPHLRRLIEESNLGQSPNIRKLQLFVKQVAYWIKDFQHILSDKMKEKFLLQCRAVRKCIMQIVKYKRIVTKSTTRIKINNPYIEQYHAYNKEYPKENIYKVEYKKEEQVKAYGEKEVDYETRSNLSAEAKSYEQKMKEFRRFLEKDIKEDRKKDTKIRLMFDYNGYIVSMDPIFDDDKKKLKTKKGIGKDLREEPMREDEDRKREEELNRYRAEDICFLDVYNKRSNQKLIKYLSSKMKIDWIGDHERVELQKISFNFNLFSPQRY